MDQERQENCLKDIPEEESTDAVECVGLGLGEEHRNRAREHVFTLIPLSRVLFFKYQENDMILK